MDVSKNTYDNVHKPSHYTEGRKYEPKDVIRDWQLGFNLGSAVKYISRAGRKDDIIQDLKKAQEFIQFEIEAIEAERAKEPLDVSDLLERKLDALEQSKEDPTYIGRGIVRVRIPARANPEKILGAIIDAIHGGN